MKNTLIITYLILHVLEIFGQNNVLNAQKYWHYRKRLREQFIQTDVTDGYGTNMPVASVSYNDNTGSYGNIVEWGDGNGGLPYYIAMLATEYRLLKNNGIDYSSTRDELFHALMAFERLDWTAEAYFKDCQNSNGSACLNGFFIRDESVGINGKTETGVGYMEESKDNVWHYLLGLALVKAIVDDNTYYYSRFEGKTTTIPEMAKGITERIIGYMHGFGWTQCGIPFVSGASLAQWISNSCLAELLNSTCFAKWVSDKCIYEKWVIRNPVTLYQVAGSEGAGVIDEIPYLLANYVNVCGFQYGFAKAGEWITGKNLDYDGSENEKACFENSAYLWGDFGKDNYNFCALFTVMGGYTDYLKKAINAQKYRYPHFVLIDYILHGSSLKILNPEILKGYQSLLDRAPDCGPSFINNDYEDIDWSTTNSLVWPEKKGQIPSNGSCYFAGIDYMLLYNLYWLV